MKEIDIQKIEELVPQFLTALGDDPEREGIVETPERVARMCAEVFEGMNYTNDEIADMFSKCFDVPDNGKHDMVVVRDIDVFSYCEHHLALMYDMQVTVAYIPKGKVIGLSKIARIADMVAKRLQLQERIGTDIAEVISKATGSEDVAVYIVGTHSCMTARGIKKSTARTVTTTFRGRFENDESLQNRFLQMM